MSKIRKINVSEIEGRRIDQNDSALPYGTLALYDDDGTWKLRIHDGVVNGGIPFVITDDVNRLKVNIGVHEKFQPKTQATGIIEHDCSSGHIFLHTIPGANWTVNLTNLSLLSEYATSITIVIQQGVTGYYPEFLQIDGSNQTINWQGGSAPTPGTNRVDVISFSIINNGGTYTVLGQLTGF